MSDSLDVFQLFQKSKMNSIFKFETEEGLNTVGDLVAYVEEKTK